MPSAAASHSKAIAAKDDVPVKTETSRRRSLKEKLSARNILGGNDKNNKKKDTAANSDVAIANNSSNSSICGNEIWMMKYSTKADSIRDVHSLTKEPPAIDNNNSFSDSVVVNASAAIPPRSAFLSSPTQSGNLSPPGNILNSPARTQLQQQTQRLLQEQLQGVRHTRNPSASVNFVMSDAVPMQSTNQVSSAIHWYQYTFEQWLATPGLLQSIVILLTPVRIVEQHQQQERRIHWKRYMTVQARQVFQWAILSCILKLCTSFPILKSFSTLCTAGAILAPAWLSWVYSDYVDSQGNGGNVSYNNSNNSDNSGNNNNNNSSNNNGFFRVNSQTSGAHSSAYAGNGARYTLPYIFPHLGMVVCDYKRGRINSRQLVASFGTHLTFAALVWKIVERYTGVQWLSGLVEKKNDASSATILYSSLREVLASAIYLLVIQVLPVYCKLNRVSLSLAFFLSLYPLYRVNCAYSPVAYILYGIDVKRFDLIWRGLVLQMCMGGSLAGSIMYKFFPDD